MKSRTESAREGSFGKADQSLWQKECLLAEKEISRLFLSGVDFGVMHEFACINRARIDKLLNPPEPNRMSREQFGVLRNSQSIISLYSVRRLDKIKFTFNQ